jgi:hypothetical protein
MKPKNNTENTAGSDCQKRLVNRYLRGSHACRESALERMISDLYRNYPEWPTTFGNCANPECNASARGSGICRDCVTECIGEITGDRQAATALRLAIESVRAATVALRAMVVPPAG